MFDGELILIDGSEKVYGLSVFLDNIFVMFINI